MPNKKIIIISGAALAIILAGALAWFLMTGAPEKNTTEQNNGGSFPQGQEGNNTMIPGANATPTETVTETGLKLLQLTQGGTSGFALISSASGTPDKIRFVEKITGHLYELTLDSHEKTRIQNKTMLRTLDSTWSADGSMAVVSFLESGNTAKDYLRYYYQILSASSSPLGDFLAGNITSVTGSPAENKIFYLRKESSGIYSGTTSFFDGKNSKVIFSSSFGEFNTFWINKDAIGLLTKPSGKADGNLYELDAKTGRLSKLVGNTKGLTATVSPNKSKVLYSETVKSTIKTKALSITTGEMREVDRQTLADKCAWSKTNANIIYCGVPIYMEPATYPDAWYQGAVSFNDAVWKIDLENNISEKLTDTQLDITAVQISQKGDSLVFVNKKDLTIWSLELPKSL